MLKAMRRFRHPIFTLMIVAVIAMTMSGFGVDFASTRNKPYAIRVGDRDVSFEQFYQLRRSIDSRYRQMFGENTEQFIKTLGINVSQQAVDAAIDSELLLALAEKLNLQASDKSVQEMLIKDLFQGQFDRQRYQSFLSSQGLSASQFENNLKQDVVRKQIANIFLDSSKASRKEARAKLEKDKTSFSFTVASLSSSDLLAKVSEPTTEEIGKIYDQNLSDYQTPAKISYKFFTLTPEDFKSTIQVSEEDIEFEYTDNQSSYRSEPQIRYSQIMLKLDPKSSEQQRDAVRKKAAELAQKIKDGASFEELARTNSQDVGSALRSGDSGWINKSNIPSEISAQISKLDQGTVSEPVETASAVYLLRVDETKEPQQKELSEVRDLIIEKLKTREAPALLALEAEKVFEAWSKSDKSLEQVAEEKGIKDIQTLTDYDAGRDFSPSLEGLTGKVLSDSATKKQLVTLADKQIFAEIINTTEEGIKPLEEVKAQISQQLKQQKSLELAREQAENARKTLKEAQDFSKEAKSAGFKVEELKDQLKPSAKGVIAESQIREKIFSVSSTPYFFDQVFESAGSFILIQATEIKPPAAEELDKDLDSAIRELSSENDQIALDSYLSKVKAQTKIDIQPSLLTN